ncbi:MAG TPA: DUF484 family protein [Burkholderiales bacterium]|nr:DUF484 family protein [Burkholderiales bacterium]
MSHKTVSEEAQKELSWEEAVSRYLEDQPDFFLRHPDVLATLALKHDAGGAVSLIEHQVQALRLRNHDVNKQLRDLLGVARENDALGGRLHQFALAMVGARSADDALDAAKELLHREFRLDAVAIRLLREPVGARPEFVGADRRLKDLLARFDGNKPILDAAHDESLRRYLFDDQALEIRSCALLALGGPTPEGLLALGAHDAGRFYAGMGTVYLARLGELLSRALAPALT